MIIGKVALIIAFVTGILAIWSYWQYYRKHNKSQLQFGNQSLIAMFFAVLLASAILMVQILTHNYSLNYVYSYSSNSLSTFYLISTFWAGQEGTILLWLFLSSVYSIILMRRHVRRDPLALIFLLAVNLFLLIILFKKSPFAMIWEVHKDVPFGFKPPDGAGLNPLLQNPWMVVHPPALFVGYSATALPFAFALSALFRKDFHDWLKVARPWIIFTLLSLGAGIMLGAYWAYETLGWGGYWGWDPVENSSLIPWLVSLALLHGVIIQIRQKGLIRTNFFLAGLSFVAMLWGSFLTRSGVLTDFSVHSFGESSLNQYLIAFILVFAGLFFYAYFRATNSIKGEKFAEGLFSRETFLLIGILSILFSAVFTFIGTSSPIFTGLVGKPSNVSVNYYNTVHIPIAFFMLLTTAIAPILAWKVSEFRNKSTVVNSLFFSLLLTIVSFVLGMRQPVSVVLFFLSVFVIVVNGVVLYRRIANRSSSYGGYLTHIGVGLMIIGIITSSMYDISEKVTLPKGQFVSTNLGYDVKFVGFKPMPDGRDKVKLELRSGEVVFPAEARFYFSDYTNSYMVSPYIKVGMLHDLYISPISFNPARSANVHEVVLKKGETKTVHHYDITFHNFVMNSGTHSDNNAMVVKAALTVKVNREGDSVKYDMQPEYILSGGSAQTPQLQIPEREDYLQLGAIDASQGAIKLMLVSNDESASPGVDMLGIEISTKPLIYFLWFGTLVAIVGIAISLFQRSRKQI